MVDNGEVGTLVITASGDVHSLLAPTPTVS